MDVNTITMDRTEARKAFLDYRRAVRERHSEEDAQIMRGYRELARGSQVISLTDAIRRSGFDGHGRPRIAVARADTDRVLLDVTRRGRTWIHPADTTMVTYSPRRGPRDNSGRRSGVLRVTIPGLPEKELTGWSWDWAAVVPIVPPALRPAHHLRNYWVLWEAEWFRTAVRTPRDPMLLRFIGGDLWAVVATWDLTEIERLVLAGRAHRA